MRILSVIPEKFRSFFITCILLILASLVSTLYFFIDSDPTANIELIYILNLVLIARFTDSYIYGIFASFIATTMVNWLFSYPYFEVNFTLSNYPVSFIGMLSIALATSAAATNIKNQSRIIVEKEKLLAEAEKEKIRATLLRAVSHDLRTPLTTIIGASSSYLENKDSLTESEKDALLSNIGEDAQWLLNMVENLLSVTRINNQGATVNTSTEPVEEVVSEAVQRLRKRIPHAKIKVRVPNALLMIPMDAVLIEQVIINLLENAVIHSKSNKEILLIVEDSDDYVTFRVRDYGIGILPDKLSTIFNGSSSFCEQTDGHRGMGIGLSICKTIIIAHQGTIRAFNHPAGAEFQFTLPKTIMNDQSPDLN